MTAGTRFISAHRPEPSFQDGVYTVTVQQSLVIRDQRQVLRAVSRRFVVSGDHRALTPDDVVAVFPPDGSLGDHSTALPHILLSRGTLPWEFTAQDGLPWLALLLFDESDEVEAQVLPLADVKKLSEFSAMPTTPGQRDDDRVVVIAVPRGRLAELMPTAAELPLLTHVRQKVAAGGQVDGELAAVIGNRLPKAGRTSTVHLVSVAGRYRDGAFDVSTSAGDVVHLVSLKSWRFACIADGPGFTGLAEALNRTPSTLSPPPRGKVSVDHYLARGYVPLPHALRHAQRTVSWYHGPLSPQRTSEPEQDYAAVRVADALLRVDHDTGMIDVSYASAWQLGRVLALRSRRFSTAFGDWRRAHRHARHLAQRNQAVPIPLAGPRAASPEPPQLVEDWLAELNRLIGVPFNYLVPDERMLPAESMRFFHLDGLWIRCLLDGALSLGRVTEGDLGDDREHLAQMSAQRYPAASGFLMRSALVSGWPGMLVDAYDATVPDNGDVTGLTPLTKLRTDRLSENVLLCLFAGDITSVQVHLKPETLHFGVEHDNTTATGYSRLLRADDSSPKTGRRVPVSWRTTRDAGVTRTVDQVVDIAALAQAIRTRMTPALFAKDMIEGAASVLFHR